jgi:hypothetical protein
LSRARIPNDEDEYDLLSSGLDRELVHPFDPSDVYSESPDVDPEKNKGLELPCPSCSKSLLCGSTWGLYPFFVILEVVVVLSRLTCALLLRSLSKTKPVRKKVRMKALAIQAIATGDIVFKSPPFDDTPDDILSDEDDAEDKISEVGTSVDVTTMDTIGVPVLVPPPGGEATGLSISTESFTFVVISLYVTFNVLENGFEAGNV